MGEATKLKGKTKEQRAIFAQERDREQIETQKKRDDALIKQKMELDKVCFADVEKVKQWILKIHPKHPVNTPLAIENCTLNRIGTERYRIFDRTHRCRTFDLERNGDQLLISEIINAADADNIGLMSLVTAAIGGGISNSGQKPLNLKTAVNSKKTPIKKKK